MPISTHTFPRRPIIVTAQKREQNLQDVAISMQAFSGDQLNEMNVSQAYQVIKLAPNVNLSGQNQANRAIQIRGIGTSDFFAASPGSVGIYMDEVTINSPYMTSVGLYDMERVEILRGPQNSLFGRNTTAGAINYISNKPVVGGDTDGFARATIGNFNRIEVEAAGTFQTGDTSAIRIAGKSFNRDGLWDDISTGQDYGEKDRKSLRGTWVWEPNEQTQVTANAHWGTEDSEVDPIRIIGTRILPNGQFVGPSLANTQLDWDGTDYNTFNGHGVKPSSPNWNEVRPTGDNRHDMDTFGAYLKIIYDMEWAEFTSITAYDESDTQFVVDSSGSGNATPSTVSGILEDNITIDQDQHFEQFSQEFRLTSPQDERLRWIAGLYYFKEDAVLGQNIRFGAANLISSPVVPLCLPVGVPPGPPIVTGGSLGLWGVSQGFGCGFLGAGFGDVMSFSIATMENEVWSPYVHLNFDISDNFTLTAGVRFTNDTKKMSSYEVGIADLTGNDVTTFYGVEEMRALSAAQIAAGIASPVCTSNGRTCGQNLTNRPDLDAEEWGGILGIDWRMNEDVMLFANYSRGFRSGRHDVEFLHGPQTGFPLADSTPETLDAYEVGLKSTLANNTLQFNVSAFFYEWNNKQTFFVDPVTGPAFSNTPKSEAQGIEFEVKWAPNDAFYVSAGLGLLDTEVIEDSDLPNDDVGHELQQAPPESFNIAAFYDIPVGNNLLRIGGDYAYRAAAKNSLATEDLSDEVDKQELLGLRATYIFGDDQRYEVSLIGENLLESRYCSYHFNLAAISGTVTCVANEGTALWGLQGVMRF